MWKFKFFYCIVLAALLEAALVKPVLADEALSRKDRQPGFLVLAADRGFAGNEDIIDEFHIFAKGRSASLLFVTVERARKYLKKAWTGC